MDIAQLNAALIDTATLRREGVTDGQLRASLRRGDHVALRPGWWVTAATWTAARPEERHVLRVLATVRISPDAVLVGVSAAALRGWPISRADLASVHVAAPGGNGIVAKATKVARHDIRLPPSDVTAVSGIRCATADRTAWDLMCTARPETAVAIADAALRSETTPEATRLYDEPRAEAWRARMRARNASAAGARGIRQARFLTEFADGRAQLPGESISRLYLHRLGFTRIRLQVAVTGPRGENWEVDLGLDDVPALAEFDGAGKYLGAEGDAGRAAASVVMAEKKRENAIRVITGLPMVRWTWQEIASIDTLRAHLTEFGIRPRRAVNPHLIM